MISQWQTHGSVLAHAYWLTAGWSFANSCLVCGYLMIGDKFMLRSLLIDSYLMVLGKLMVHWCSSNSRATLAARPFAALENAITSRCTWQINTTHMVDIWPAYCCAFFSIINQLIHHDKPFWNIQHYHPSMMIITRAILQRYEPFLAILTVPSHS